MLACMGFYHLNFNRFGSPRRFAKMILAILLCALPLTGVSAQAEKTKIGEIEFAVEKLVPVDNENVKVTLFGETRIVAKRELAHYVLGRYLSSSESAKRFTFSDLKKLLFYLQSVKDVESAGIALVALIERYPENDELPGVIDALVSADPVQAALLFKSVVTNLYALAQNKKGLAEVLYHLVIFDPEWTRGQALSVVYRVASELHAVVEAQFKSMLLRHSLEDIKKLSNAFESVWGSADPLVSRMKLVLLRVSELQKLIKYDEVGSILPGLEARMRDPELSPLLSGIVVELIHQRASSMIDAGGNESALKLLAQVTAEKRTPTTHKLTLRALQGISNGSPALFAFDPDVFNFIKILASNDSEIQMALVQSLQETAAALIAQGNFAKSEELLPKLIEVIPEPSQLIDGVRYAQAAAYASHGLRQRFEDKVSTIGSALPLLYRLKLIVWRVRSDQLLFIATGSAFIIFFGWLGVYANRRRQESQKKSRSVNPESSDDSAFAKLSVAGELSPKRNEYERCLQALSLTPKASLQEIKAAYRNLVKEFHPDRQKTESAEASDEFIRLTQVYDRALSLRKELELS